MKEKILAREKECFDFLREIPIKRKFLLIGGYAISSFDFPRLSVDLDIVIPKKELKFFRSLIKKKGFKLSNKKSGFDSIYKGEFEKYIKKGKLPVYVDLLINSVQARQTNYSYSFDYLFKNSEVREIRGWHPSSKIKIRVANKEMLIALKTNSMRNTDKRDIILLCYKKPDIIKLFNHLKNCPKNVILMNIDSLLDLVMDSEHGDSIKGVFTISDEVLKKATKNTIKIFNELKRKLDKYEKNK